MTAAHPLGPWSAKTRFVETCGGQPTNVMTIPTAGGDTVYLYQGDLWNNFERNQATAAHFWKPLEFGPGGGILPVDCSEPGHAPIPTSSRTASPDLMTSRMTLRCDVGGEAPVQREVRFAAPASPSRLRGLALPIFKKQGLRDPLAIEVMRGSEVLHRIEVRPEHLTYAARRRFIATDVALTSGESHAIRFSSTSPNGCYGFGFYPEAPEAQPHALLSRSSGSGEWLDAREVMRVDLWVE